MLHVWCVSGAKGWQGFALWKLEFSISVDRVVKCCALSAPQRLGICNSATPGGLPRPWVAAQQALGLLLVELGGCQGYAGGRPADALRVLRAMEAEGRPVPPGALEASADGLSFLTAWLSQRYLRLRMRTAIIREEPGGCGLAGAGVFLSGCPAAGLLLGMLQRARGHRLGGAGPGWKRSVWLGLLLWRTRPLRTAGGAKPGLHPIASNGSSERPPVVTRACACAHVDLAQTKATRKCRRCRWR
jgi:hypothetical protein